MSLQCLHQVWAKSALPFGRRYCLKNFKMAVGQPSWSHNGTNLAGLNLHVSAMPPTSFSLIRLTIWKQMSFQDFQAGHHGSHLGYWNGKNLAIANLHVTPMPPTKFWLNQTYRLGADGVWRFSRWPLWGYIWNGMILAILNLYVATMPPIKFQLNPTYDFGDVIWRFSWWPSWILEWNHFSNPNSLSCDPNASHQVWAQSDLGLGSRCGFKIFKMATWAAILDSQMERF